MVEAVTFGEVLRRYRHAANMTIEELSAASGVSVRAIGNMERGLSLHPQRRTVAALAERLGLPARDQEALANAAKGGPHSPPPGAGPLGVYRLPRDVGDFTGRRDELSRLEQMAGRAGRGDPALIATVSGGPGVGKTALVIHAATILAEHFPDGCFFIDLQGMGGSPLSTGAALSRLLRAFGVTDNVPEADPEQAGFYRSVLRDRRSLIVLDNADDEAQVRPLLPGGGGSLVLITSRRSLAGLEAVRHLPLTEMPPDDAVQLLRAIVGTERSATEDHALQTVVGLCGNLPLAIRIAGNRLLSRPGWRVGHLAGWLADAERRLESLSAGDLHVAAAFAVSYRHLSLRARRLFRLLALVPGSGFGVRMGAVLSEQSLDETQRALEELVELGLLQSPHVGRYRLHDLVRLFARNRLNDEEPPGARQAALERTNTWLLNVATAAARRFDPEYREPPADFREGVPFGTREEAHAWLEVESTNWLAALKSAASEDRHARVAEVADAMRWFSNHWTHWGHWREVFELARGSAHALGDHRAEAAHLNHLAWALDTSGGRSEESVDRFLIAHEPTGRQSDSHRQEWALAYATSSTCQIPDWERATRYARQATQFLATTVDWEGYLRAAMLLGDCLHHLGRPHDALKHDYTLLIALHDPAYQATLPLRQLSIALILQRLGQNHAALGLWRQATSNWRIARSLLHQQETTTATGNAHRDVGSRPPELGRPVREELAAFKSLSPATGPMLRSSRRLGCAAR